jgi:uncharacterized protein
MKSDFMPLKIDIFKEAKTNQEMHFSVAVSSLPRVLEALPDPSSELGVSLFFGVDGDGQAYVDLNLKGTVQLMCQRCLAEMPFELSTCHRLIPVSESQVDSDLIGDGEPILIDASGLVDVVEMLEDELLLTLPMCPMHPLELCDLSFPESLPVVETEKTKKSFAGLADLLNKNSI